MLQDVKIVAFTQFLLGPAAVQYLADMGAQVVKIEPVGGAYERHWSGGETWLNGVSAFFLLAHRNNKSVTLNLKSDEGQAIAQRLVDEADVVVENFRPGVAARLGLDYEALRERNPRLIYASASGYGSTGPYTGLPGQDLLLQALTGLAAVSGPRSGPPIAAGAAVVDQHSAALLAMGVLAALHHRDVTGDGQLVEVNMVQGALDLQLEPFTYQVNGGTVQRPTEPIASSFHEGPYGFYETVDGFVALSLSPIAIIAAAIGEEDALAEFADRSLAFDRRDDIHRALAPILRSWSTDGLVERLRSRGVWCSPVNDYKTALEDPIVANVDPVMVVDHPEAGSVTLLRHPITYGSWNPDACELPPMLGEHTDETLARLGYAADAIEDLRRKGII